MTDETRTTAAKVTFGSLAAALLLLGGAVVKEAMTPAGSLGEAAYARGARRAILVAVAGQPALRQVRPFNPGARLTVGPYSGAWGAQFQARYGFHPSEAKGNTVGERYSPEVVAAAMNAPGNPLDLACHPSCTVTVEEEYDSKLVTLSATGAYAAPIYDSILLGLAAPPAPPTPTVPPPATPTPAPPTPTPPPPTGALQQRTIPCPDVRSTAQLCIEVWQP